MKPPRPAPLSVRLSPENRARLERDAVGMSLGSYIQWRLFDPDTPPPRHRGKAPVKDHAAMSAALAALGKSNIANNLNQIARAVHTGVIVVSPEVEAELIEAARHIASIRHLLIEALGLSDGSR
ncbi:plasmid mobilization relaxosome protein MobC [Sphingobium sp. AN558]|uniref:plasmid mobilization relaxosome protein MobC n=1 Tax=Sphingobium sp. AN558 TaxID=3133442 RepID=UPI0030C1EDB2